MLHFLAKVFFLILLIFIYCEFIIYYFVLLGCSWSQLSKIDQDFTIPLSTDPNKKPLHVMLIADTHLMSSHESHWFNKLRRDWQMHRSLQSAIFLFEPQIIFVLGDLTNAGQLYSDYEWNKTVHRFQDLFSVPSNIRLYVLAGNHDIGFHSDVTDKNLKRFGESFQTSYVRLLTIDDEINFVLINSMAFEGDQCRLCESADNELKEILNQLHDSGTRTKPVLLSHFPLYRLSEANCSKSSSTSLKSTIEYPMYRERYDVLSQEATKYLLTTIKPRLVFTAHTHRYCYIEHSYNDEKTIQEWTVPSFSWTNRDDPSFMLLSITTNNQRVSHCYLPRETTIFWSYAIGGFLIIFYLLFGGRRPFCLVMVDTSNRLNAIIMFMAEKRGLQKTFCPSERARQLAVIDDDRRLLMEPIRPVATELIDKGQLVCKQRRELVNIRTVKGFIRLQIASN
ncbi:unnamed protein product [Rotaria socialis]|uniref:Calcineurin-like phosphoesterase domain-containing protein n=1 Tax=Rotaria socialis TaxID=392032 RepID=A0A820LKB5_9BILA|nr:unnamed protein product [Rotaria socialis]CAF3689519.1 unnamed protein product [Rotaria socialis]CAF4358440.1 unnamed protein product [Rotaria socialis]CAF4583440.1 unnamed protein product [Rotaria socialis]